MQQIKKSMLHSGQENSRAAPKKRKLEKSYAENFNCSRQALSERSLDSNFRRDEDIVSPQRTKADDEHRPKVGLLQRIQERRREARTWQRREEDATVGSIAVTVVDEAAAEGKSEVFIDAIAQEAADEATDGIAESREVDEAQASEAVAEAGEDNPGAVEGEGSGEQSEVVEEAKESEVAASPEGVVESTGNKLEAVEGGAKQNVGTSEGKLDAIEDGNAYTCMSFLEQYRAEDGAARWAEAMRILLREAMEEVREEQAIQENVESGEVAGIADNMQEEHGAENQDAVFKKRRVDEVSVGEKNLTPQQTADATEQRHQSVDTNARRGAIVRLHSLESVPELNGLLGLCLYQGDGDRWVVHLDSEEPGRFRNVRPQNLEFVCCGGAVQPVVPQHNRRTAGPSASCGDSAAPISAPATAVKCKDSCQDEELPLAERFAELEREQFGHCDADSEKPLKASKQEDPTREISVRLGAEGLVEDILETPDEAILKRLMLASTEDLAKVVSPEAMAYIVLAKACRTRTSGG